MWLRLSKECEVDYVHEPLVYYNVHSNRISTNYESLTRGLEAQLRKHDSALARSRKTYSERYLSLGVLYCYQGRVAKGRQAFFKAIRLFPFEPRNYFNLGLSLLGGSNFRKIKEFKQNHAGFNWTHSMRGRP